MNPNSPQSLSIRPYEDLDELHEAAANAFCEFTNETLTAHGVMRVSLSGGSTPKGLYELLSLRDLPWNKIHWFWGDERNVPSDHADSNARMVREALFDRIAVPESNIHTVPIDVDDPQSAAEEYEQTLRQHFPSDQYPRWDLALLGMGDDAHTASLFPDSQALEETQRWFVENWVEKYAAFRYTLTAPAINSATQSWFLVAGESKREAVSQALSAPRNPRVYPAQLIQPTRWFITRDAAPGGSSV